MSLIYGPRSDAETSAAEVISDFRGAVEDRREVLDELTHAAARDGVIGTEASGVPRLSNGTAEIFVGLERKTVAVQSLADYCGLQFRADGVLVTLVTRRLSPELLRFVRVTDLEPMLAVMEHLSRDEIAAWFEATREDRHMKPPSRDIG